MKLCGILCIIIFTSCLKTPDESKKPTEPEPEKITYADLKIRSFTITPECNERVFGTVTFTSDNTGTVWTGRLATHKLNVSALVASFDAVASKIEVKGTPQQSGQSKNDFSQPVTYRLYADDGQYKEYSIKFENTGYVNTGRPVLAIVTNGEKDVTSRETWVDGRLVIDRQEGDFSELVMDGIQIKGRGHNTWSKDKKPYNIKLPEKVSVVGMNKHKRWCLLANASDRTLLRNRVAFEIGRRTGLPWTPDNRFVEVVLNGKMLGSYLLAEQIRVDKNRVNIAEMTKDDNSGDALTGGYLLEFDRYYDEVNKFRTATCDLPVNIKDPDEEVLTAEQKKYISDYVNKVEELLYSGEAPDPTYRDYIDINSFADWWIVIELCHNRDTKLPGSCHMYKARNGKLYAGPLWDFDLTTFLSSTSFLLKDYEVDPANATGTDRSLWYKRLFADPVFVAAVKERWASYYAAFQTIPAFIDAEADAIAASAGRNWTIWTFDSAGTNQDGLLGWREAVDRMKTNYTNRLSWMNTQVSNF